MNKPPCVFDAIISGESAAEVVLDEPELMAFLDIRPVFPGHTLVVPRTHWGTVSEAPAGLLGGLMLVGRRVAQAQQEALGCQGTFFGLNDVVSQSVPHVHLHVIPRTKGDGLKGFFWPRRRYAAGEAEQVATSIRLALEASDG